MGEHVTAAADPDTIDVLARTAAYVSDLLIASRCRDGEEAAAAELFRSQQKRVHATLYRVIGSTGDMEDLLQETFIQVFRSLHSYRGEAKLSTWVDRIAARVAYKYLTKRRSKPAPIELNVEHGPSSPPSHNQVAARIGISRLYDALDQISPTLRVAFALFEIDGRSMREVAELLGCTNSTAKLRVWRARRSLFKIARSDAVLAELLAEESKGMEAAE